MIVSKHTVIGLVLGLIVCGAMALVGFLRPAACPTIYAIWLLLGTAGLLRFFLTDPAVRQIGDALAILPLPVAGWIEVAPPVDWEGEVLPGMGRICTTVHEWLDSAGSQVLVTSGDVQDGKSLVASGLALSLSDRGLRVTVVDVNLEHPTLHKTFSSPQSPGLTDHLSAPATVDAGSITHVVKDNLQVIPAGTRLLGPDVFEGETFKNLVAGLQAENDVIIFDGAAASESRKALALLNGDVHLLAVVRMRHTYVQSLRQLSAQLCRREVGSRGLVFFANDQVSEDILASTA